MGGAWEAEATPSKILQCASLKDSRSYSTGAVASKVFMGNENMERVRREKSQSLLRINKRG